MRSKTHSIGFGRVLASAIAVTLLASGLAAAAPQSITISPTSVSQTLQPGSTTNGDVKIINSGTSPLNLKVYATPYSVSGTAYRQDFTPKTGQADIASWFHFPATKITAAPNQTAVIPYSITVPANTSAGGYYATVFAETQPSADQASHGVVVHERLGTIFYLQVGGNVNKQGQFLGWHLNSFQTKPLSASLEIKNTGNVHFPSTTSLTVTDLFGHTKLRFTTTKEILPATTRQITAAWPTTPVIGLFKVSGSSNFLGQTHQLKSQYVLVIATWLRWLILAIIVILLALLGLWISKRLKSKRD